uniref:Uncharacterized protein n=1 Tax=Anguilla anguilla TaxID=7936 RepID=A0A0E9QP92_ANGAN
MNKTFSLHSWPVETHPRFSKTHSILPFLASRRREVETYDFPDQIKLRDDKPASSSDGCKPLSRRSRGG